MIVIEVKNWELTVGLENALPTFKLKLTGTIKKKVRKQPERKPSNRKKPR